jgi:hypothetical protein
MSLRFGYGSVYSLSSLSPMLHRPLVLTPSSQGLHLSENPPKSFHCHTSEKSPISLIIATLSEPSSVSLLFATLATPSRAYGVHFGLLM